MAGYVLNPDKKLVNNPYLLILWQVMCASSLSCWANLKTKIMVLTIFLRRRQQIRKGKSHILINIGTGERDS
jgi:hypothetical protein